MEAVNFRTRDLSFIANSEERRHVQKLIDLELFQNLQDALIQQEFSYYDEKLDVTGTIDLLLIFPKKIQIIDYKLKKLDNPGYVDQLKAYRDYLLSLPVSQGKTIEMYLLSILDCSILPIMGN
jgi:ATP-dependent exoDNAse (exonuclease V) beta subunit